MIGGCTPALSADADSDAEVGGRYWRVDAPQGDRLRGRAQGRGWRGV